MLGALLVTAGLVTVVYGFSRATVDGWSAGPTLGVLVAGAALIAVFLIFESTARSPLPPLSVVRHRGRGGAYLVAALMMAGPFGAYLFTGFFLQRVLGFSAFATGLAFLPLSAGVIVSTGVSSSLTTRVLPRFVVGAGLLVGAAGMMLLTRLDVGSGYLLDVLPSLILIGLGMGMVLPPALSLTTIGVRPAEAGVAGAMFNVSSQVGASLGTALLNTVASGATATYVASHSATSMTDPQAQVEGYATASAWGAGILAFAGVAAMVLINTVPARHSDV